MASRIASRIFVALLGLTLLAPSAHAGVTEKDVLVIGRVLALLNHAPSGTADIAIATAGPATQGDSATMESLIGSGKQVGTLTLTASPVRYDQLAQAHTSIVFVPDGLTNAELAELFETAKARKLITISTSDACIVIQKCAIAVTSAPAVDIRLSLAAAAATNVSFGTTFRMIIKEVQ